MIETTEFFKIFSQPQIGSLLQSIGEGLVIADLEGRVTYMNSQAEKILGKSLTAIQGNHINDCHRCPWKIEELLKNQPNESFPHRNEVQMGKRWLSVTATPITGPNGQRQGSAMIVSDTTHHHKLEERLRHQFDELQERQKRLELQIYLARQIQKSLLPPEVADLPGLRARFWNHQSQVIGGDFTFIRGDRDGGWIIFGDVMGKGVFASQFVPLMLGYITDEIPNENDPGKLLQKLNERLFSFVNERFTLFVTLLCVHWNAPSRKLLVASAGHPSPILVRAGKFIEVHEQDSLPLGIVTPTKYQGIEVQLESEDQLLMFSDGLTEPPIGKTPKEGAQIFLSHLQTLMDSRQDLFSVLTAELDEQATRYQPRDDQTLIALTPLP